MLRLRIGSTLLAMPLTLAATASFAKWEAVKDPFGAEKWRVTNTDNGQTVSEDYDSEKKAKKTARILNKADKSVMAGPNGEGDYRGGGGLPKQQSSHPGLCINTVMMQAWRAVARHQLTRTSASSSSPDISMTCNVIIGSAL